MASREAQDPDTHLPTQWAKQSSDFLSQTYSTVNCSSFRVWQTFEPFKEVGCLLLFFCFNLFVWHINKKTILWELGVSDGDLDTYMKTLFQDARIPSFTIFCGWTILLYIELSPWIRTDLRMMTFHPTCTCLEARRKCLSWGRILQPTPSPQPAMCLGCSENYCSDNSSLSPIPSSSSKSTLYIQTPQLLNSLLEFWFYSQLILETTALEYLRKFWGHKSSNRNCFFLDLIFLKAIN